MILIIFFFNAFSIYEDLIKTSRRDFFALQCSYFENNVKITRIKSWDYEIKVTPHQFIVRFFIQRVLEECPHDITFNRFFYCLLYLTFPSNVFVKK